MPTLSPKEWSRQANELQKKAGRPLDRIDLEKQLGKPNGKVTRSQSLEKGGAWKPRTGNRKAQSATRGKGERTYTTEAARSFAAGIRKNAREQTSSTQHQYGFPGQHSIGEHTPAISFGGIGDNLDSVSDPIFKQFKDNVERKVRSKYGDKYVVDINDVTGYLRVIPKTHYNKQQYRSQQPGFDVEPDMDIDRVVNALPILVKQDLSLSNTSFPGDSSESLDQLTTPQSSYMQPTALGGFDMSRIPSPSTTANPQPAFNPPTVYGYGNGNGNGNGNGDYSSNGGNGNGNGSSPDSFKEWMDTTNRRIDQQTKGLQLDPRPLPVSTLAKAVSIGFGAAKAVGGGLLRGFVGP